MQIVKNADNLLEIGALEGKTKKENQEPEGAMGDFADIWGKLVDMQKKGHGQSDIPLLDEVGEIAPETDEKTHESQANYGLPFMMITEVKNAFSPETTPKGAINIRIDGDAMDIIQSGENGQTGNESVVKKSEELHNYAANPGMTTGNAESKSVSATQTPFLKGSEQTDGLEQLAGPETATGEELEEVVEKTTEMKSVPKPGETDPDSHAKATRPEDGIMKTHGTTGKTESTGPEAEKSTMEPIKEIEVNPKEITGKDHSGSGSSEEDGFKQPTDHPIEKNLKNEQTPDIDKGFAGKTEIPTDMQPIDSKSVNPDATESITDGLVVKQVIDKVNLQKLDQGEILRVRLKPDSLGSIAISLKRGEAGITATISTTNSEVQRALAGGIEQLATSLTEYGISRDVIEVVLEDDYFGGQETGGFMFGDRSPNSREYGGKAGRHVFFGPADEGMDTRNQRHGTSMIDIYA